MTGRRLISRNDVLKLTVGRGQVVAYNPLRLSWPLLVFTAGAARRGGKGGEARHVPGTGALLVSGHTPDFYDGAN